MAGDPLSKRRRGGVRPALTLVDLGQHGVSLVLARLEPDGRFQVGNCIAQAVRLEPHQAAVGQQGVSKIVVGFQLEGPAVILLGGRNRLRRFLPEPHSVCLIGVRLSDLGEGLAPLLPGDQGTHQVKAHQVAMAPDAHGQAGPRLA